MRAQLPQQQVLPGKLRCGDHRLFCQWIAAVADSYNWKVLNGVVGEPRNVIHNLSDDKVQCIFHNQVVHARRLSHIHTDLNVGI